MKRHAEYIFMLVKQIICLSRNPNKHRETTCPLEAPNIPTESSLDLIIVLPEACLPLSFLVR